jgi:hypothetical protein
MLIDEKRLARAEAGESVPAVPPSTALPEALSREVGAHGNDAAPTDAAPTGFRAAAVEIPSAWETAGVPKAYPGPVWFRKRFRVTGLGAPGAERTVLRFDGVSYYAGVWLNGRWVGSHRGIWDRFEVDVTDTVQEGENELVVEVQKPGGWFPVAASTAGFIPYVTTTFGGIWQDVALVRTPTAYLADLHVVPSLEDRAVHLRGVAVNVGAAPVSVVVRAEVAGETATEPMHVAPGRRDLDLRIPVASGRHWSPEDPALTELTATIAPVDGEPLGTPAVVRFGMRGVETTGTRLVLNGTPTYPRGLLNWCAYPDLFAPRPSRERIANEIRNAKALGYTMIKLCLVVPWEEYFDAADELGMLLWVELPLWLPKIDDEYRVGLPEEYARIVRRVRNHPSVVLYTLGCELDTEADAELLRHLYDVVKAESGGLPVRDNSGSAECYGGVELEFADFYDYHFYAEANQFADLVEHFYPPWRERKPLLFGEYCDSDTFRSVAEVRERQGSPLWWTRPDPVDNPQGVRWDYNVTTNDDRLARFELPVSFDEMKRRSYARSLEYRKDIIEQTRRHPDTSGYVITNLQDTPVTTSGMLDDFGTLKFSPDEFRRFNGETVLALATERRRIWRNGGDRRQFVDEWCVPAASELRRRVICSHSGATPLDGELHWELSCDELPVAHGTLPLSRLEPRTTRHVGTVAARLPEVPRPTRAELRIRAGDPVRPATENAWTFWVLPEPAPPASRLRIWDPRGALAGISRLRWTVDTIDSLDEATPRENDVLIATMDDPRLHAGRLRDAPLLLILDGASGPGIEGAPFFREAVPVVLDHPIVDGLPHDGYAGIHWKGVAPDRALHDGLLAPVVSRFDARTFLTTHYLLAGETAGRRTVITTLRLAGGSGRQPAGPAANVLGRTLLARCIAHLEGRKG